MADDTIDGCLLAILGGSDSPMNAKEVADAMLDVYGIDLTPKRVRRNLDSLERYEQVRTVGKVSTGRPGPAPRRYERVRAVDA